MVDYSKLLNNYISEASDLLDEAEEAVLALENGFEASKVDRLFRAMHTIKGNAGLFDLVRIRELAHAAETVLGYVRNQTITLEMDGIDLILMVVDRLRQMMSDTEKSNEVEIEDLIEKLNALAGETIEKSEDSENGSAGTVSEHGPEGEGTAAVTSSTIRLKISLPSKYVKEAELEGRVLTLILIEPDSIAHMPLTQFSAMVEGLPGQRKAILPVSEKSTRIVIVLSAAEPLDTDSLKSQLPADAMIRVLDKREKEPQQEAQTGATQPDQPKEDAAASPKEATAKTNGKEKKAVQSGSHENHLKVSAELIQSLINLASETVIARNELVQKVQESGDTSLQASTKKINQLVSRLQEEIMRTRLQELDLLFQRVPRLVRDTSHATGKQIELVTEGGDVELDRALIDAISDPVTHLVRNAIDHGIEGPEERKAAGKDPVGRLELSAGLRSGNVILNLSDDGRGLNYDRIREKAIEKGIASTEHAMEMDHKALADLIFLPGFSTSQEVTTTSGRGVGMDVVRSNLKRVGGSAEIVSETGKGTTVTLVIPQTLSILNCLLLRSGDARYGIAQANLKEVLQVTKEDLDHIREHLAYELRGHLLPVVDLQQLLWNKTDDEGQFIAVVATETHRFGLLISEVLNSEEVVIRPLGPEFADVRLFAGAAIMGDGEAVLIMDVASVARHMDLDPASIANEEIAAMNLSDNMTDGYLLFDSAGYRFGVPVGSVPRVEKISRKHIDKFLDLETINYRSQIVPLVSLDKIYDLGNHQRAEDLYMIVFQINGFQVALLADDVFNVEDQFQALDRDTYSGPSVHAQAISNEVKVLLLDIEDLAMNFKKDHSHKLKQKEELEREKEEKQKVESA